jgi:hypothetical protein
VEEVTGQPVTDAVVRLLAGRSMLRAVGS